MLVTLMTEDVKTPTKPSVSVIVCTRDRADQLKGSVRAILASSYTHFELVVVDQSHDTSSADVIAAVRQDDQRIRLVRDAGRGLSRARNLGIAETTGEYVVFTDDDCVPAWDWLERVVSALEADQGAGVVFGSVVPGPYDPAHGFIDGYIPPRRRRLTGRLGKLLDGGIGANMGYRRSALEATGGFDDWLGAGGYFASCEDGDMAYRTLASGYALLHAPDARVIHHGLRDWPSGRALTRRTYVAVAAAYMKYVRLADPIGVCLVAQQLGLAMLNVVRALARGRKPFGIGRLCALGVGMWRSFELDVEPGQQMYRPRPSET